MTKFWGAVLHIANVAAQGGLATVLPAKYAPLSILGGTIVAGVINNAVSNHNPNGTPAAQPYIPPVPPAQAK